MYSSTSLKGPSSSGCWKQLDYIKSNAHSLMPLWFDTDIGIAAHAVMQFCNERRVDSEDEILETGDDVARKLISSGHVYRGHQSPPMPADDVYKGVQIAVEYLMAHPVGLDGASEVRVEQEIIHPTIPYSAIMDLFVVSEEGDEESTYMVAEPTDYKTAWTAAENELETMQRWGQAVIAWRTRPEVDCIRVRVVNLRSWKEYSKELWVHVEQDVRDLERWEKRIAHLCETADSWEHGKRPANAGFGCISCPYTHICEHSWDVGWVPLEDHEGLARELSMVEARRKLLIKTLKESTETKIDLVGGYVGFRELSSRVAGPNAEADILKDWLTATASELPEDMRPVIESLLVALKLGKTNLDSFAKALMPQRKKGVTNLREDYVKDLTTEVRKSMFGVWES